jgi:regulatory protein
MPQPLDQAALQELALRYVGKYATTRAKLRTYLGRKLRERGWEGDREPDLEVLGNRFAELGYIDDASYALGQSRSLSARGYGKRRLTDKLRSSGVEEADSGEAIRLADKQAVSAALRFAERRRLGPYAALRWNARNARNGSPRWSAPAMRLRSPGPSQRCHRARNLTTIN